jgi:hypothetical protein
MYIGCGSPDEGSGLRAFEWRIGLPDPYFNQGVIAAFCMGFALRF